MEQERLILEEKEAKRKAVIEQMKFKDLAEQIGEIIDDKLDKFSSQKDLLELRKKQEEQTMIKIVLNQY